MADEKVQLSTIRVSAELNAASYKQGAADIVDSNQKIDASGKQVAATVQSTTQKISQSGDVYARLARLYVDGYAAAQKFQGALAQVSNAVERGNMSTEKAVPLLTSILQKFGLMGDAAMFAARGQTELAAAVQTANERLSQQQQLAASNATLEQAQRINDLRLKFDSAYASAQKLEAELRDLAEAERLGALTARQAGDAYDRLILKYDETATAMQRAREEQAALNATQAASQNQQRFTQFMGVSPASGQGSARDSASVFEAEFARVEDLARQRAAQAGAEFARSFNDSLTANLSGKSARDSASVFAAEFDRVEAIAQQRAQQAGAEFARSFNDSLTANVSGKSARDSASVFTAEFDRLEAIAQQRAQQIGEDFTRTFNQSLGIGEAVKSAAASFAVFEDARRETEALETRVAELTQRFNPAVAAAQKLDAELRDLAEAERLGVVSGQQASDALSSLILKYDTGAVSAKRLTDEIAQLRAQQEGANFQADLNQRLGIGGGGGPGAGSARASAAAFEEAAQAEEELAKRVAQLRAELDPAAASVERMNAEIADYNELLAKGKITTDEFDKAQALAAQRHIGSQEGQGGLSRFGAMNAAAQLQDIAVTAQMGQSVTTIALQQGTQLGQALESAIADGEGLIGIVTGLGTAVKSLFSVTNIFAIGLTAATVIAVRFFTSGTQKAEDLTKATRDSEQALKDLAAAYGVAELNVDKFGQKNKLVADASARQATRAMEDAAKGARTSFATETQGSMFGTFGLIGRGGATTIDPRFMQFQDQIMRLRKEINEGRPDFERFFREVNERGNQADGAVKRWLDTAARWTGLDVKGTRESADALIELAGGAAQATKDFIAMADAVDRLHQIRVPEAPRYTEDQRAYDKLRTEDIGAQALMRRQFAAERLGFDARSPQELATAARAQAAAQPSSELPGARNTRIEIAGLKVQEQAEIALKKAQDDRVRAMDRTLEQSQLEVSLIGKSTAEKEGLRMADQKETEIRQWLTDNHLQNDPKWLAAAEAEIRAAREKAMVNGQLVAQQQALTAIQDQEKQLETLRKETSLVGTNREAHDAAIRTLETEQKIRELGIATLGAEASQMRLNTTAINEEIAARNRLQLISDTQFEREQLSRPATEQETRRRLRAAGQPENLDSPAALEIRKTLAAEEQREYEARVRGRQRAIEQAQEEIGYIGQTVTVTETLRFENEQLAAARERAAQRNEQVSKEEIESIHKQAVEIGRLAAQQQAQSSIQQRKEEIEMLRGEIAVIGESGIARDAQIERLKTEIEIRKLGTGATKAQTDAMRAETEELIKLREAQAHLQLQADLGFELRQAGRSAEDQQIASRLKAAGLDDRDLNSAEANTMRMINQINRIKDTWQELFDSVDKGVDTMVDALFNGTDSWSETLKKIGRDFARQMFDLALTNPLKNWLTGANLNTVADLFAPGTPGLSSGRGGGFGGALGSLFGAQKTLAGAISTATMQVQAATVVVNGSVLPGVPGVGGASTEDIVKKVIGPNTQESSQKILDSLGSPLGAVVDRTVTGSISSMSGDLAKAAASIRSIESGSLAGDYSAVGKMVTRGRFAGERAIGAYQMMPGNIPEWSKMTFGQSMAVSDVQGNKAAQDAIFNKIFGGYAQKGGYEYAAKRWFGVGMDDNGMTTANYLSKFRAGFARAGAAGYGGGEVSTELTTAATKAAESLTKVGLAGFESVKGLTTATGGLTEFGKMLGSFMAPGGGSSASWFQNLASSLGGAPAAVSSLQSSFGQSPQAMKAIFSGSPGLFHSGGIAGSPSGYRNGVPDFTFYNARRYHNGGFAGLAGDEVPAILKRGEPVFRSMADVLRYQAANENGRGAGGGAGKAIVNLKNINVFDPSVIGDYVRTDTGEQAMLNMMRRTGSGRGI